MWRWAEYKRMYTYVYIQGKAVLQPQENVADKA